MSAVREKFQFKGMMAPIFAPFKEDGSLNLAIIPRYAQFLHDNGVTGVFVNGTMGEGMSLTTAERKQVLEAWCRCRDMAGDIVVHIGGTTLEDIKEMARHAVALDVAAISCLPPLYDKPATVSDLVDYMAEVATAAPNTPLLYYHIPFKTGVKFPMDQFLDAAGPVVPSLAGMKFTAMEVEGEGAACLKAGGGGMTILPGFEQTLSKTRPLGYPGAIHGCFNFMPLEAGRLFCLAALADNSSDCCIPKADRKQEVLKLQQKIDSLWVVVDRHCPGYGVSGAKVAMKLLAGLDVGPARRPNRQITLAVAQAIERDLKEAGFNVCANPALS